MGDWGRNLSVHEANMEDEEFNEEDDLPKFLESVIDKAECIFQGNVDLEAAETHAEVIDQSVRLIRSISECADVDTQDKISLNTLAAAFTDLLSLLNHQNAIRSTAASTVYDNKTRTATEANGCPGRPRFVIRAEILEELRELGFSWTKIAEMLGVSRWTIHRRIVEYGLENMTGFHHLADEELDKKVKEFISTHGCTPGQSYVAGYLKSVGLRIQRKRIRESMARVDPHNTALRWGIVISRRKYHVPWPNSLWHLDGHHSLIRWKMVIHGCMDGYSRRIMFLRCSANNHAKTVLELFLDAVKMDGNLWPSRIRVDKGVENVLVCEAMINARGEGRGSFIAGPSTHNQRIERLWRDVFRCVCHLYYYIFYAMESTGILDTDNPVHLFTLHLVFIPRINKALDEFREAFNHHKIRTERNCSPNQMWMKGMFHPDNPLAHAELDEEPDDLEMYGHDPYGPSSAGSDNNVVVEEVHLPQDDLLTSFIHETVDLLRQSDEMGVDIYTEALELLVLKIDELTNSSEHFNTRVPDLHL